MILLGREEVDRILLLRAVVVKLIGLAILFVFSFDVDANVNGKAIEIQSDLKGNENVASPDFFVYDDPGFGLGLNRGYAPVDASCDVGFEDSLSGPYIACFGTHGLSCPLSGCVYGHNFCAYAICSFFPFFHYLAMLPVLFLVICFPHVCKNFGSRHEHFHSKLHRTFSSARVMMEKDALYVFELHPCDVSSYDQNMNQKTRKATVCVERSRANAMMAWSYCDLKIAKC